MKEKIVSRIIIQVSIQILSAISSFFILRNLPVEQVGIQGSVISSINIFSIIYFIGIDVVFIQYSQEKEKDSKFIFSNFFLIKIILLLLNLVSIFIYLIIFSFDYNFYFIIMSISTFFLRLADIFCLNLRVKLKIIKGEIVDIISGYGLAISKLIISLNIYRISNPLLLLGFANLFFYFLKFIISVIISRNEIYFSKPNKKIVFKLIKKAFPLIFSTMFIFLTDNLGSFIIALSYDHENFAQYYAINSYFIIFIVSLTMSLSIIYQSYFSKWLSEGKSENIKEFSKILEKYTSIIYFGIVIFIYYFGKNLITSFLPNYIDGIIYLKILIFLPLLSGINRPYIKLLYSGKKQKLIAKYYTFTRGFYVIIILILIPEKIGKIQLFGFGALGVCFLQIGLNLVDYFYYRYYCKKFFDIDYNFGVCIHLLGTLILIVLNKTLFLPYIRFEVLFLDIIIKCIIFIAFYLLFLIITKQITSKDFSLIKQLIKIKNYKKCFKAEF